MCNVPCCEELLVYEVHALVQVQGILLHINRGVARIFKRGFYIVARKVRMQNFCGHAHFVIMPSN